MLHGSGVAGEWWGRRSGGAGGVAGQEEWRGRRSGGAGGVAGQESSGVGGVVGQGE